MNKPLSTLTAAAILTFGAGAYAADEHKGHDHGDKRAGGHAHEARPVHGGVVAVVKDVNYELVAKGDTLSLYVTDHGKPVDLKGASAKLTLLSGTERSDVVLSPAGDRLEARGGFKASAGTKVAGQVTLAGGGPVNVRFTLK